MEFNYAIDILGLAITVVLMFSERKNKVTGNSDQKLFRILLHSIAFVFLFDIPAWLLIGKTFPGAQELSYFLNTAYYLAQIIYCLLWFMFAACWNHPQKKQTKLKMLLCSVPAVVEIFVILSNPITGWVFTIDANNVYERADGGFYYYNLIPYMLYILGVVCITLVTCFRSKNEIQKKQSVSFLAYIILPIIGTALQMFNYGVSLLWPFTVMSLIMIYLNVQQQNMMMNQIEKAQAEQELTQANVSIMLSQIQPHFLYNSLTVIKTLCRKDPALAEQVTVDFSNYLRGNLDSISTKCPIRFSQELEHTKNFLKLEKLQYGDKLDIIYDIRADAFMIPTLTLQPIAENAVKYGFKQKEHITVRISSYEDEKNYYVAVEDDGTGFDPTEPLDKARSHIGISNVRNRLEVQAGSTIDIQSTIGTGTKVTIIIPKERVTL